MVKIASVLTLLITAIVCLLPAAPAQAQRARVFVASYGSDSNPCTFGSPCKTFQHAHDVVAAGGEVTAIDSAGFGPVSITKSVTITSPAGVEAGIAATTGGTAIAIAAPGATVQLRGLTLEGANAANYGIDFTAGSRIEIVDCTVSDFAQYGIYISTTTAPTSVMISNSIVTNIGVIGVDLLSPTGGSGTITAVLDHVTISNANHGFNTVAQGGPVEAIITDSHIDNSTSVGIDLLGTTASATSSVILTNVTLNENFVWGIYLNAFSTIWLSQVTQINGAGANAVAINFAGGASSVAYSDATNHLMGSNTGGSTTSWPAN